MNDFRNPTTVTLGLRGTFMDKPYRVAGRVVMGMEEGGEIYYWNEFNLLSDDGSDATLVYENTDAGPQWRMFVFFEPQNPLTAQDAAAKKIGDTVNLDGRDLRVTLVDESRVYHIEGQPPEGVELGDVARYFNAELPNRMVVVSWTGDEVECFHGIDLPRGTVGKAFELERETTGINLSRNWQAGAAPSGPPPILRKVVSIGIAVGVGFLVWATVFSRSTGCRGLSVTQPKLPASPLNLGAEGTLQRTTWRVRGHTVMEIAQVGRRYSRHEYHLADDTGNEALLVLGAKPDSSDWTLFQPFQPGAPLTPTQAAAKRLGDKLDLDGASATLTAHQRATVRQTEATELPELTNGTALYGFTAQVGPIPMLVRWNATHIAFYRGRPVPGAEVKKAFPAKPKS